MAARNYKGHVIVELKANGGYYIEGFGTYSSVKEAKEAIDNWEGEK